MERELYNSLAALLSYPEQPPRVCHSEAASAAEESAVASELAHFLEHVRPLSSHDLQELFIQTFDLSPVCSLEMGWHLFGENYDRGLLLVKLRQQLRAHEIAEGTELPDHLTYALHLLPCMEREEASYFAEAIVLPALEKMLAALRGKENPYEHVLSAVRAAIRADFPEILTALPTPAANPLPVLA
jgi:nitrate reductase delta subunit